MKKILVLRIYNSNELYDQMKEHHLKYDNSYFVTYDPNLGTEWQIDGRMIKIKGTESYKPGILEKTLKALEICLDLEWDYIVRSNMSTVIDMVELQKLLESGSSIYGGHVFKLDWICEFSGITEEVLKRLYGLNFVSGTSIVMSKNVCEFIVKNSDKCDRSIMDDVSIGYLLKDVCPSYNIPFSQCVGIVPTCCFYRYRDYKDDRSQNIKDMGLQYELLENHYSNTMRGTICIASSSCAQSLTA